MNKFTDIKGQSWIVRLNVGLLGQLRREAEIDLSKAIRDERGLGEVLFAEPENLVKALWCICSEQAAPLGITPEQFAFRFDGSVIEAATEALLEAVTDFFPRSKIAQALKANLRKTLDRMDSETVKELERRGSLISNEPAGNSAASVDSTHDYAPSGS